MPDREPSVLDRAVAEHRAEHGAEQPPLFDDAPPVPAVRPKGRPPGAIGRRTELYTAAIRAELAHLPEYRANHGDPLVGQTRVAALDILDDAVLAARARLWACSRLEVVKIVLQAARDANPYHHQTLPRAVVINPGAPGGDRVLLEVEGEFVDVTPTEEDTEGA